MPWLSRLHLPKAIWARDPRPLRMTQEGFCSWQSVATTLLPSRLSPALQLRSLSQIHLLPSDAQCPGPRTIPSHPGEEGRVEWGKKRPHLKAPPPPSKRLRLPGVSRQSRVPGSLPPQRARTAPTWGWSAGPQVRAWSHSRRLPRARPICSPPDPPSRVLTKSAVVVTCAVYRAIGEDLQVEACAAIQLAAPQDPLQVGEVCGRGTLQLPLDLAQALIQETGGVS